MNPVLSVVGCGILIMNFSVVVLRLRRLREMRRQELLVRAIRSMA